MKIHEIILEQRGKLKDRQRLAQRGMNKFSDGKKWNGDYTLYRLGLAVASTDGKTEPDVDDESWVGKWKLAAPYTQVEQDMLNLAYKAVGANVEDINHGDLRSQECNTINRVSPVSVKKKNKYGV
jgi:hypothetical protein